MCDMEVLKYPALKYGFATQAVPMEAMSGIIGVPSRPRTGDLVLAEVISIGQYAKIENRSRSVLDLFTGDRFVGVFGNSYATDQFEGYVPEWGAKQCDMLSIGGVLGEVVSKHAAMKRPTRVKIHGAVCDQNGTALSTVSFGLKPPPTGKSATVGKKIPEIILVVGSSMNAGQTTVCGTLARALRLAGYTVGLTKITGTAASKDRRFFKSCGAIRVLDFTDAGFPATYMLSLEELIGIYRVLIGELKRDEPDFIVVKIADGMFQRETKMLLEATEFINDIDHVFLAANDSLAAECGVWNLKNLGAPLRAVTGALTRSHLHIVEAEKATGLPCLSMAMILEGRALELITKKQVGPFAHTDRLPYLNLKAA